MTPERTRWGRVLLIFCGGLLAAAQFGKMTLVLDLLQLPSSAYAVSAPVLVSTVGVVGIVFGVIAGGVVSRFGLKRAMVYAFLFGGVLSLYQASLPRPSLFFLSRVLEGVSHLAIVVAGPTLIAAACTPRDRPVAMGLWACFFGLSFALIAAILPWLLALGGLRAVFGAHGAAMLAMSAVLAVSLPRTPPAKQRLPGFWAEHRAIYGTMALRIPGLVFVWYTAIYIALLAVLPGALLVPVWVISAMPLWSLVGTFLAGFLCRFVQPLQVTMIGFAGSAVLMIGVAVQANPLVAVFALMAVMGLVPGACFAAIPRLNNSDSDRARATGALAQLGNVGTTLGTPLFAFFAVQGGVPAITALTVGLSVTGLICAALFQRQWAQQAK